MVKDLMRWLERALLAGEVAGGEEERKKVGRKRE